MKLKVKATGETLEVAPDSYICGLHPNGNEVEFLAEDVEIIPNDWSAFRWEAALRIYCSQTHRSAVGAIEEADKLIKELKEDKK